MPAVGWPDRLRPVALRQQGNPPRSLPGAIAAFRLGETDQNAGYWALFGTCASFLVSCTVLNSAQPLGLWSGSSLIGFSSPSARTGRGRAVPPTETQRRILMPTTPMQKQNPGKYRVDGAPLVVRHQFAATTIGCRVPRKASCGHIGAVFRHACLVLLDGGGVVALLAPPAGQVAHGVRLAEDEPMDGYVRRGMPARICGDAIVLGTEVAVTLSSGQIWTPSLRLGMCEWDKITLNAAALARNVLVDLAAASRSEFLAAALQIAHPVTALGAWVSRVLPRLAVATDRHDANGALLSLRELIGLGPGLTPAGDDFTIGWLAGLTLGAQSLVQRKFLAAMCAGIETLSWTTTPISRQHLADACALMFSERLSAVCVAIANGASRSAFVSSMAAQLAVGGTSGADAAAGLMFALFDCGSGQRFSA
jgi:hypothetical protein